MDIHCWNRDFQNHSEYKKPTQANDETRRDFTLSRYHNSSSSPCESVNNSETEFNRQFNVALFEGKV